MNSMNPPASASTVAAAFDLTGRVCIVTGGSRGLGQAMAAGFAQHGAHVVVASRNEDACKAFAAELSASTGVEAMGVACHVADWQACAHLIDVVHERFGSIDVLVNNAGSSPLYSSLAEIDESFFDKVLGINLKGPFRLSVLAAEHMQAGRGGSIINVSSIAAVSPERRELPYAVAKAALNTLTIGLARSYGPTVRVNAIMPGPFLTDIARAWDLEKFDRMAKKSIPLARAGEPHEIVGAALYLASDASSYTTGAVLKIDGGTVPAAS